MVAHADRVIEVERLCHVYPGGRGVRDLDLVVARGGRCGFLGPNGAGKSTTLRVLLGFLRADSGRAAINGLDCWRDSRRIKRDVGYLPGDVRVHPTLTARQALALLDGLHGRDVRTHGRRLCDLLELSPELPAARMSRGTRQKLGLVMALAHQPSVIVLDEPTTALDPLVQGRLLAYLRDRTDLGDTLLFSSHGLAEVEQLCEQVVIVRDGKTVADTSIEALRGRARRTVRLVFVSEERATATEVPHFLKVLTRAGRVWAAELDGAPSEVLRWAAELALDDCHLAPPDLEAVFRAYYPRPDDASETPAAPFAHAEGQR